MVHLFAILSEELGDAGWSSPVARQAHNLKVVGSNPTPATNKNNPPLAGIFIPEGQVDLQSKIFDPVNRK